jgi:hypothetical protein
VKHVQWLGGPRDGEAFKVPDAGAYISTAVQEGGALFQPNEEGPQLMTVVYRVPIILTRNGWRAVWNDRQKEG